MNLAFTLIVKKVFDEHIFPGVISRIVDQMMNVNSGLDIKGRYGYEDLEVFFDEVHHRIMTQLFSYEEKISSSCEIVEDVQEEDSDDESFDPNKNKRLWIVNRFVEEYEKCKATEFNGNPNLLGLIKEYIDILDSPYFESTLYEMLDETYSQIIKDYLLYSLIHPVAEQVPQSIPDSSGPAPV